MKITLATATNVDQITVNAQIIGPFGVHLNPDGDNGRRQNPRRWTLTHVQTGLKLGGFRTRKLAKQAAVMLLTTDINWDFQAGLEFASQPDSTRRLAGSIIRYYQLESIKHLSPTDLVLA